MIEDFSVSPRLILALRLLSLSLVLLSGALSRFSCCTLGIFSTLRLGNVILGAHLALRGRLHVVRERNIKVESQDDVFASHINIKD